LVELKKKFKKVKKIKKNMGNQDSIEKEKEVLTEEDKIKEKNIEIFFKNKIPELKRINFKEIKFEKSIGSGSFGTVWKGELQNLNEIIAVKILKENNFQTSDLLNEIIQEVKCQIFFKDVKNFVKLFGYFFYISETNSVKIGIVMEFIEGKNLNEFIDQV
jgi:serine/threonine protein kinase